MLHERLTNRNGHQHTPARTPTMDSTAASATPAPQPRTGTQAPTCTHMHSPRPHLQDCMTLLQDCRSGCGWRGVDQTCCDIIDRCNPLLRAGWISRMVYAFHYGVCLRYTCVDAECELMRLLLHRCRYLNHPCRRPDSLSPTTWG
jgi:hypothetical protein